MCMWGEGGACARALARTCVCAFARELARSRAGLCMRLRALARALVSECGCLCCSPRF